jgi:hypothetical protein
MKLRTSLTPSRDSPFTIPVVSVNAGRSSTTKNSVINPASTHLVSGQYSCHPRASLVDGPIRDKIERLFNGSEFKRIDDHQKYRVVPRCRPWFARIDW